MTEHLIIWICSCGAIALVAPKLYKIYTEKMDEERDLLIAQMEKSKQLYENAKLILESSVLEYIKVEKSTKYIATETKRIKNNILSTMQKDVNERQNIEFMKIEHDISKKLRNATNKYYSDIVDAASDIASSHIKDNFKAPASSKYLDKWNSIIH